MLILLAAQEPTSVIAFIERFGLPVALLFILLWAMLKTARWIAPRLDKLISRHERLLDTLEQELANHSKILTKMEESQSYVVDCLRAMEDKVGERA